MTITFEETQTQHYHEFLRICRENMKEYCEKFFGGWSDSKNEKNFNEFLKLGGLAYAIKEQNFVIGYFCIIVKSKENIKMLFINDLQIDSKYQRRKIGTKALEYIENLARAYPDINGLELKVFNENPAKTLYLRFGFEEIQEEFNKNGVLMRKSF